jgi:hypothetical protein
MSATLLSSFSDVKNKSNQRRSQTAALGFRNAIGFEGASLAADSKSAFVATKSQLPVIDGQHRYLTPLT